MAAVVDQPIGSFLKAASQAVNFSLQSLKRVNHNPFASQDAPHFLTACKQ
jgi:hypothetical protein